jgi:CcmD family protein
MNRPSLLVIATFVFTAMSAAAFAFQPPPPGQDGFIAAKDLPQAESIPAAPLLVAAYAIIWVAAIFYLWTIWRRLNKVEADIRTLERTAKRTAP